MLKQEGNSLDNEDA